MADTVKLAMLPRSKLRTKFCNWSELNMYFTLYMFIIGSAFTVNSSEASGQILHVTGSNISALHPYLDNSFHQPLCVVFTTDSQLEKDVLKFWQDCGTDRDCVITTWILAHVSSTQTRKLPRYLLRNGNPSQSPVLRCFLGPMLPHDFDPTGPTTSKQLQKWLYQLATQHRHLMTSSVDLVKASVVSHRFTLLVFPTHQHHQQLEHTALTVADKLGRECAVNTIVIHPSSANILDIVTRYEVFTTPSVLLIEKESSKPEERTLYNVHDVMTGRMETDMRASLIPAPHLSFSEFKADVMGVSPGQLYSPYLVAFYAHWEEASAVFLSFLRDTVLEFRSLGADARFGLVDAARNPEVVVHYMSPQCIQHLPFLAIFYAEAGEVMHRELAVSRPTPFTVFSALQQAGLSLTDTSHQPISYQPYGLNLQVCSLSEAPGGDRCSAANTSWLTDDQFSSNHTHTHLSQAGLEGSEVMGSVPLATGADWGNRNTSDDTHTAVSVNIFIFIRYPCKSCEQNQPVFLQMYQQLVSNDSYRVSMVNCSETPSDCERHHVTGFPTVLAFRYHSPHTQCPSAGHHPGHHGSASPVRLHYHGVFTVGSLMDWVSSVSISPIHSLQSSQPQWTSKAATARLVATVVPLGSPLLPASTHRSSGGSLYSTACLAALCERLFGLLDCFTVASSQLSSSQLTTPHRHHDHHAVVQVDFQRRDGVSVTLMELGQPLVHLLDRVKDSSVHLFHTQHRYELPRKQKCEDDHGFCTTFLESFSRDHLRLPVTPLTSEILHAHNEFLFGMKLPVLLALVEADYSSEFHEVLQQTAYQYYQEVMVATLDVGTYSVWAGSFVPRHYNRLHAASSSWGELSVYPRLVLFYWHDHSRAAFFPPVQATTTSQLSGEELMESTDPSHLLTEDLITDFVQGFLKDPASHLIETERF